jgi:dienelactone hydrolase
MGTHTSLAERVEIRFEHPCPLVDEPVGLVVAGCVPGAPVVVRASVDALGAIHEAVATFDADKTGVVNTARQPSRAGTYTGVDPFGLWWSGDPVGPSATTALAPIACRVQVETAREVTVADLERHWLAPGVAVTEVDEPGVWGLFARPAGPGPFPGIVAFGGSGGGLGPAAQWAPILASHGFATLAVGYFGAAQLPRDLVRIEVEVAERAVAWLAARADVAGPAVAAMGVSRGSELAFLAGALFEDIGAVVAFAPSGISWGGLDADGPVDAAAWTFRGVDVPYAPIGDSARTGRGGPNGPVALAGAFEAALHDRDAAIAAEIPIENTLGPILMVSGEADAMWPSGAMGELVEGRAAERGFSYEVSHLRYGGAGHVCAGVPGVPVFTEVRHPLTHAHYSFGGSRAASARARADSWPRVLTFLREASVQEAKRG